MNLVINGAGKSKSLLSFDPRTKLFMLLVVNTIIISDSKLVAVELLKYLCVFSVFILLLSTKKLKMSFVYCLLYFLARAGLYVLENGLINGMSLGGVILRVLVYLVERMLPSVMLAWFVLGTTKVSEFIAGMEKLHLPQSIIIPFAIIFRFFPTLADEYKSIQDAMKMRGIRFAGSPISAIEYRLVPLIVSVTKIGDELSASAMTRGLVTNDRRSSYVEIGFKISDVIALFISLCSIILFAVCVIRG